MSVWREVVDTLQAARRDADLHASEVDDLMGWPVGTTLRLEGRRQVLTVPQLIALCRLYQLHPAEVVDAAEDAERTRRRRDFRGGTE